MPTIDQPPGGPGRNRTLDALRNLAGVALAGAFVFFLVETVRDQVERIGASALWPGGAAILLSVGLLFAWALMFLAASESCLRRLLGVPRSLPPATSAAAFFKSFLLRYVPGKIWTAVGRAETLAPAVPRATTFRCLLYEQLHLNVATLGLAILMTGPLVIGHGTEARWPLWSGGAVAAAGLLVWLFFPNQIFGLINRLTGWAHRLEGGLLVLEGSAREWRSTFMLFVMVLILQALAIAPLIQAFAPEAASLSSLDWFVILAAYPVARLVGQLSLVVPGGVGVREGAYVLILVPVLDPAVTTSAAAWMRLLSLIPEIALYGFFEIAARRAQPR